METVFVVYIEESKHQKSKIFDSITALVSLVTKKSEKLRILKIGLKLELTRKEQPDMCPPKF